MSLEAQLTGLFREVLAADSLGPDDHFFRRGGHSLAAMQAVVRLRERLGVDVPVSALFEHPTPRGLAALVATLPATTAVAASPGPATTCQLSTAERGMWFLDHAMERRAAYLLPDAWGLRGPLDVAALSRAVFALKRRHPALTTRFTVVDGMPHREVVAAEPRDVPVVDLSPHPAEDRAAELARLASHDADCPIDLTAGDLLRVTLVRLAADDHVLLFTVHHIASDAWSQRVLRDDLARLYCRERAAEAVDSAPRDDAPVVAETRPLAPDARATLLDYWRQQLADLPALDLPTDRRRGSVWSDRGGEVTFELGDAAPIDAAAAAHGVTVQMLLLAAFEVLVSRYSQQRDFGVATFASTRDDSDAELAVGLFVNTIVVRADLSGDPSFAEVLGRVRRTSLAAYDHRALPFEELVALLRPDRDEGATPLARVAFQYLPFPDAPPAFAGLDVSRWSGATARVRFDLEITVRRTDDGCLHALLGYSAELFEPPTVQRFATHFTTLVAALVAAPERAVADAAVLPAGERAALLDEWSGLAALPGTRGLVHALVAGQAWARPDAPALVFGATICTYGELDDRARALAADLAAAGVGRGHVVAVHVERSPEFVIALLGVLAAGAAYLPLDPSDPVERRVFLVRDTGASAVVHSAPLPCELAGPTLRAIAVPSRASTTGHDAVPVPGDQLRPDALAYVMYTSGSTGRPKGVAVTHQAITRLVRDTTYVQFRPDDGVAFASNLAFDAATFEIWGALVNGARLVHVDRDTLLSPPALARTFRDHGVTVMFMTAALFRLTAGLAPAIFAPIRTLIVGGDVVDPRAARAVLDAGAPGQLVNGYGPTENTTFSTTYRITSGDDIDRPLPIGRPISGSTAYVLDERQGLAPVGARGELYVGGTGLAHGYVQRPELTAERFVAHPFIPGERLYRTGDTVRWRWDGVLEFLGRTDRQIKLRGFRIELDEIEQVLSRHPAVAGAVVLLHEGDGLDRLVAYVSARAGAPATRAELRTFLLERVPGFMVPDAIDVLEALPLTANGKVDQAVLRRRPRPLDDRHPSDAEGHDSPLVQQVREACREVLDGAPIAAGESFFAAGGTSLSVLRLLEAIHASTGRRLVARDVFAHPTPAAMAAFLTTLAPTEPRTPLITLAAGDASRPPLYLPPGLFGDGVLHDAFVQALPPEQPVHAFQETADGPLDPSISAMAARLIRVIDDVQPSGPLSLAGYSFSGLLACEMARQLRAAGREIAVLAILDTGPDLSEEATLAGRATLVWRVASNVPRWIGEDVLRTLDWGSVGRWARSARKLVRGLSGGAPGAGSGTATRADDLFDVSAWPAALQRRVDHHLRLIERFTYDRYDGEVVLLRARVRPLLHAHSRDLGWRAIGATVRVVDVPGNHVTMMQEPHVRVVAARFREAFDTASARTAERSAITWRARLDSNQLPPT